MTNSPAVRIVVDSTADVPADVAAELGISIVPLTVRFGTEVFRDRIDISLAQFVARLTAGGALPTTAQPSPGDFLSAYRPLLDAGASIVSLHLSSKLSGTYSSALVAARDAADAGQRVDVIDSGTLTLTCGLVAIEAARAAQAGATHDEVVALVTRLLGCAHLAATLDTLEYAYRGGRVNRAQALAGSLLSIKPTISVQDGAVVTLENVRTRQKSLQRLVERITSLQQERGLERLAILHVVDITSAELLASQVAGLLPREHLLVAEIGPVVATFTGPRGVGFAALTAR